MGKLRIAEVFTSIQGEGHWIGVPSLFIRISGCNLRCSWCDTPYASWNPEGPTVEVADLLSEIAQNPVHHVVVTGGEPMLFEPITELCSGLRKLGKKITIETAGTVYRDLECDLMSISPKLANSTPTDTDWEARHESTRIQPNVIKQLVNRYAHVFKFVVNPDDNVAVQLTEIEEFLALTCQPPMSVILMAEGTDAETLQRREQALVPVCIEKGYRLTPRYHVTLFGNTKGT